LVVRSFVPLITNQRDADITILDVRQHEGRSSGVAQDADVYHCFWLRHVRFIRAEDHLTPKGALHALGLSGQALEAARLPE
jgi:hypothetical protein